MLMHIAGAPSWPGQLPDLCCESLATALGAVPVAYFAYGRRRSGRL